MRWTWLSLNSERCCVPCRPLMLHLVATLLLAASACQAVPLGFSTFFDAEQCPPGWCKLPADSIDLQAQLIAVRTLFRSPSSHGSREADRVGGRRPRCW